MWTSTPQSVPVPAASCTFGCDGVGWSAGAEDPGILRKSSTASGQGLHMPPPPPHLSLGSSISGDLWGGSSCHLSSKPGCPGKGGSQVPGTERVAGPSSDPTFAFHVVVHLKLHFADPEESAVWMDVEVAAAAAVRSVQGMLDTGEGRARDWGTGGWALRGKGAGKKEAKSAHWLGETWDQGWVSGVGGEKLAHLFTAARQTPEDPPHTRDRAAQRN